jgi:hypothetical protein
MLMGVAVLSFAGDQMKEPSQLGRMIEEAVEREPRFISHPDNVQYLCCFRTISGKVFAFERVTKGHINLWLPEDRRVKAAAEVAGREHGGSVRFSV